MLLVFAPFALILLALSLGSAVFPRTWSRVEDYFFIAIACVGGFLVWSASGSQPIIHTIKMDYIPFMTTMTVLGLTSSLISFHKGGKASPLYNTLYLAFGACLSNIIGTMASAMVLWPPLTHLNRHQASFRHGVVFFIIIVCNVGACLTPLGDPPLLVGYLRGVPFLWLITNAWKAWVLAVLPLLGIFYLLDRKHNPPHNDPPYIIRSPSTQAFAMLGVVIAITLMCPPFYRELALIVVGIWAWKAGGHIDAHITRNIACLFLALFITLIPVQSWLAEHAHYFVKPSPQFNFWSSGLFSAFLDNTPTYIVWTQLHSNNLAELAHQNPTLLQAISLGCVWMGGLTYIGNAPNLIVRAYAHKHAPAFLGYMLWSWGVLIPLFGVISWVLWGS